MSEHDCMRTALIAAAVMVVSFAGHVATDPWPSPNVSITHEVCRVLMVLAIVTLIGVVLYGAWMTIPDMPSRF